MGVYRPVMAGSPNPSSISDQKMSFSTPVFQTWTHVSIGRNYIRLQSYYTERGIESVGFDQNANKKIS